MVSEPITGLTAAQAVVIVRQMVCMALRVKGAPEDVLAQLQDYDEVRLNLVGALSVLRTTTRAISFTLCGIVTTLAVVCPRVLSRPSLL